MAVYEYRCPCCSLEFEVTRPMSEYKAKTECPTCGAVAIKKASKLAGLVFKGPGFYKTDYGSANASTPNKHKS